MEKSATIAYFIIVLGLPALVTIWHLMAPTQRFFFKNLSTTTYQWFIAVCWLPGISFAMAVLGGGLVSVQTGQLLVDASLYALYPWVGMAVLCTILDDSITRKKLAIPEPTPEPIAAPPPPKPLTFDAEAVLSHLTLPPGLVAPVMQALIRQFATPPSKELIDNLATYHPTVGAAEGFANSIKELLSHLPKLALIGTGTNGQTWGQHVRDAQYRYSLDKSTYSLGRGIGVANFVLPKEFKEELMAIPISLVIPLKLREETHIHILAKTRWGKTQLLQSLILDTIEADIPIIVIDSQEQMLNKLATRVHEEKLILIDPTSCPAGLNPFDLENDPASLALLPYMFGGIGSPLVGKQISAFNWLGRLIVEAKGDMTLLYRFLKEPELPLVYYSHLIQKMGVPGQSFFTEYAKHEKPKGEYKDTRDELIRRLDTILGNEAFAKMLFASRTTLDMSTAISQGMVVLISTAKPQLGDATAALIGRFYIAQVFRACMKAKRRVVVVCDEFQDYAEDSQVLFNILSQSAKYGLELIAAHQMLGSAQLPDGLRGQLATNAGIKLAGGVSAEDRANMARQMDCEPEFIAAAKKGTFAAKIGDDKPIHFPVPFGRLEALPEIDTLPAIRSRMRKLYSAPPRPAEISAPNTPLKPREKPQRARDPFNPEE